MLELVVPSLTHERLLSADEVDMTISQACLESMPHDLTRLAQAATIVGVVAGGGAGAGVVLGVQLTPM
jgi:uridylate kinase